MADPADITGSAGKGTVEAKPGDFARAEPPSRFGSSPSPGYAPPVPVQRTGPLSGPPPLPGVPGAPGTAAAPSPRPGGSGSASASPGTGTDAAAPAAGRPGPGGDADGAGRRRDRAFDTERGTTIIANEVVEKIAAIAARGVPGVYDLGGDVSRAFSAFKERIGLGGGDGAGRGVSVRVDGRRAQVRLTLVVEYGFVVLPVTEQVRAEVVSAAENMLGLEVTTVDIVVDDVHVPDDHPAAPLAGHRA